MQSAASVSVGAQGNRRAFACLSIGRDVSALGEWVLLVALMAWIYHTQESAALISILLLAQLLPAFLLAPVVRSVVRIGRSRIIGVAAQLVRAALLLLLVDVKFAEQMRDVYVVVLMAAVATVFYRASHDALLSSVTAPPLRGTAGRVMAATAATTLVVGGALGTFLYESAGLTGCVTLAFAASVVSGLLLIPAGSSTPARPDGGPIERPSLVRGLVASFGLPTLRSTALLRMATGLLTGGLLAAQAAFVTLGLFLSAEKIGYVLAGQGFGVLVGLGILGWARRRFCTSTIVATALLIAGMGEFGYAVSASLEVGAAFAGIAGFGLAILAGSLTSMAASASPDALRGSVSEGLDWATAGTVLLSAISLGPLADAVTPRFTLVLAGVLLCVLALYAFGAVADSSSSTEPSATWSPSAPSPDPA